MALLWLLYSALLTAIALPDGLDTEITPGIGVQTPLSAIAEPYKGDISSYAEGGIHIVEQGWFAKVSHTNLWPPGAALQRAGLLILVSDSHVVLGLVLVGCLTWAVFFTALTGLLSTRFPLAVSLLLPPTLLIFTLMHSYMLRGGTLGSDAQGTALLAIALVLLAWSYDALRTNLAMIAGAVFAASAYFRAQTELLMTALTLLFLLMAIAFLLAERRAIFVERWRLPGLGRVRTALSGSDLGRAVTVFALALVTFHLLCLPWRLYHLHNDGYINWVKVDYYWQNHWRTKEETPEFLYAGGASTACYVNPKRCARFATKTKEERRELTLKGRYFKASIKTLLQHPVKWVTYKFPFVRDTWLQKKAGLEFENFFILFGGLFSLLLITYSYLFMGRTRMKVFVIGMIVTNIGFNVALFTILHTEARYFFPMKFLILFCLILAVTYFFQREEPPPPSETPT